MSLEQDKAAYKTLCSKVEAIDKEAAKWLREVAPTYPFEHFPFRYSKDLTICFIWEESPQGNDYWKEIGWKLSGWVKPKAEVEKITVPTFDDVEYKRNDGKDLTALEQFVYDNEPTPESGKEDFRKGLQALIDEVTP